MSLPLEVINASWHPRGGPDIVSNINFTVPEGKTLAICGPNGSGKSTLLRMLYRFQKPTAGRVLVGGQDLWQMQPRQAACLVAAVLQEQPTDFALNVSEMVMLGRNPHRQGFAAPDKTDKIIVEDALAALELTEFAGQPFGRLSGGERQRVMVARALAQRPQVLILDEPTNHLDIRHQLEVLSLVRNIDCTVVCTLHDLTLASEYTDMALVLSRGKMVSFGEPKGVLTAPLIKQTYNVTAQIDRANGASRFSYHL